MRDRLLHPFRPSAGERSLLIAAGLTTLVGVLMTSVIVADLRNRGWDDGWGRIDSWCALSGGFGALGGLYLGRAWLGGPGALGTLRALAGIVVIGFLSALVAGTLILPGYGTMFGPMILLVNIAAHPALALGWCYALILAHLLFREYRLERGAPVVRPAPLLLRPGGTSAPAPVSRRL